MGRSPCCSKEEVNRGAWTAQEDNILTQYIKTHGEIGWRSIPKKAGLNRCGKSCRLRWLNYLRPDIKRGNISLDEEELIIRMHRLLGNRWSLIAGRLPGRTDNEIKNYWNTHLSKKLATNDPNSKSHIPVRTSSWPQLSNLCNGTKEAGPSRCSSEDNEATKSTEELDVSKSWTQFLEDSIMADIAEDPLIDLNNASNLSPLEVQNDPPNVSCSTSSSDLAQHNSLPSEWNALHPMQLPCIDFGMIHDFSLENLLQPEAYYLEALSPNQCCDNVDHADCFAMAAEQGMTEIYNNTLQQPHSIQQEQHPQQCEAQKPSQMELDELDELFHYEEPRESHVQSSLTTTHDEEEYKDILVDEYI